MRPPVLGLGGLMPSAMEYLRSLVLLLLMLGPTHARADIRCYCNAASCISTGYMCKSARGRCYSQLTHQGDHTTSAHGCAELLPLPDRKLCEGDDDVIKTRSSGGDWPILVCCKDDMCNYIDNLDINISVNTKSNGSVLKGGHRTVPGTRTDYRYLESQREGALWFKAAVIAVPIAGGFILLLLVILAVRLLRQDGRRHRQLLARRRNRSLAKAQLYVADHFCDKHAHFNHLDSCKPAIYKEVNVTLDGRGYEKMTEAPPGSCNSIIVWGKGGKLEPASAV